MIEYRDKNGNRQLRELTDFEMDIELMLKDIKVDEEKLRRRLEKATEDLAQIMHREEVITRALEVRREWNTRKPTGDNE